jgi:hypothetical protein
MAKPLGLLQQLCRNQPNGGYRHIRCSRRLTGRGLARSPLLGAVAGGVLLDGLTISAIFSGSLVLAGFAIALIGIGRRLLKPE